MQPSQKNMPTFDTLFSIIILLIISVACQFTVQPVSVVEAQGVDAVFECRYPGAQNHNWVLNGVHFTENSYPPDVTRTLSSGDRPARLTIPATAQYNNTVVQCEAVVRDGGVFIPELSVNATLQVQGRLLCVAAHYGCSYNPITLTHKMMYMCMCTQLCVYPGPLHAVADLTVNNIAGNCSQLNVTWVAPFSLNLTTAEPDIKYCVDVYNVTYEREDNLLQSECSITTIQYMFDVAYPVGTYSFSVTPQSNIDGSLNGTISTGQFSYGKVD